jgi:hypothetical protein
MRVRDGKSRARSALNPNRPLAPVPRVRSQLRQAHSDTALEIERTHTNAFSSPNEHSDFPDSPCFDQRQLPFAIPIHAGRFKRFT